MGLVGNWERLKYEHETHFLLGYAQSGSLVNRHDPFITPENSYFVKHYPILYVGDL